MTNSRPERADADVIQPESLKVRDEVFRVAVRLHNFFDHARTIPLADALVLSANRAE